MAEHISRVEDVVSEDIEVVIESLQSTREGIIIVGTFRRI